MSEIRQSARSRAQPFYLGLPSARLPRPRRRSLRRHHRHPFQRTRSPSVSEPRSSWKSTLPPTQADLAVFPDINSRSVRLLRRPPSHAYAPRAAARPSTKKSKSLSGKSRMKNWPASRLALRPTSYAAWGVIAAWPSSLLFTRLASATGVSCSAKLDRYDKITRPTSCG